MGYNHPVAKGADSPEKKEGRTDINLGAEIPLHQSIDRGFLVSLRMDD